MILDALDASNILGSHGLQPTYPETCSNRLGDSGGTDAPPNDGRQTRPPLQHGNRERMLALEVRCTALRTSRGCSGGRVQGLSHPTGVARRFQRMVCCVDRKCARWGLIRTRGEFQGLLSRYQTFQVSGGLQAGALSQGRTARSQRARSKYGLIWLWKKVRHCAA